MDILWRYFDVENIQYRASEQEYQKQVAQHTPTSFLLALG